MCYHNYQHYHQVATKTYGTIGFILLATDIELHFLKWVGGGGGGGGYRRPNWKQNKNNGMSIKNKFVIATNPAPVVIYKNMSSTYISE